MTKILGGVDLERSELNGPLLATAHICLRLMAGGDWDNSTGISTWTIGY